jgi:hypothetical protein
VQHFACFLNERLVPLLVRLSDPHEVAPGSNGSTKKLAERIDGEWVFQR